MCRYLLLQRPMKHEQNDQHFADDILIIFVSDVCVFWFKLPRGLLLIIYVTFSHCFKWSLDVGQLNQWWLRCITIYHVTGLCLATATWRCRKNFSQWKRSFLWKLCCHWLKGMRQRQITVVRQSPGPQWVNTLRPRQNGRHFADVIFKCIFLNENLLISIKISLKFVP